MRIIASLLLIFCGQVLFAQGTIRRADSLTNLLQTIDPAMVATGGKVTYLVPGYYTGVSWGGEREITATKTPGTTNRYNTWMSPLNTNWYWRATGDVGLNENVLYHGAKGDGVTDDTAALQSAANATTTGRVFYSTAGKVYLVTEPPTITNSYTRVEFNGSKLLARSTSRKATLQIGSSPQLLSGLNISLVPTTNVVIVPPNTFAAGDMVLLYNTLEDPTDYNPGLFAFVSSVSGTNMTLDRFPSTSLQVSNAYRFVSPPIGVTVSGVIVDLSGATNGLGISVYGQGHVVEQSHVYGSTATNDRSYIGIEVRGQNSEARNNIVQNILDAGNTSDRAGYGIFLAGDNVQARANDVSDCKHCISTSERRAISPRVRILDNRIRQRDDWASVLSSPGLSLFLGALDVHANVTTAEIRGNDIVTPRLGLSLRNGDFDVINNRVEVREQSGLSYTQFGSGFGETFITRAVFSGNIFITPTNASHFYWDHSDYGATGVHRHMIWQGNFFYGGGMVFNDQDGSLVNPFSDLLLTGNLFSRTNGTPLAIIGPVTNVVINGNVFNYGGTGNGLTLAIPTNPPPGREVFVGNNAFSRASGGTGYDIDATEATNVVSHAVNRWAPSTYSYVGPVHGIASAVPVAMHDLRDAYPRIIGTYDGRLKFGPGDSQASTSIKMLYPGSLETDGIWSVKATDLSQPVFGAYLNNFSNFWNFGFRGDGILFYRYLVGTNPVTSIVAGPRREEDLINGVWRLTGNLGLTSNTVPILPEGGTVTLNVENTTTKVMKLYWPDGTSGSLWHAYNDGSGSGLDADVLDGQDGAYYLNRANHSGTQSYTTITGLGALATASDAPSDGSDYARRNGGWNALGSMANVNDAASDGSTYGRKNGAWVVVTNTGGGSTYTNFWYDLTNALVAGGNVSFSYDTNNNKLTITATASGGSTNGTSLSIDDVGFTVANLKSTTGFTLAVSGTNILLRLTDRDFGDVTVASSGTAITIDNGVITTNKIDTAFHTWITGKAGLADNNVFTGATNEFTGTTRFSTLVITNMTLVNPMPNLAVSNATPSRLAKWGADYRLTNEVAATGTGSPVYSDSPTLTGDPKAPTATAGDNDTSLATTAFVTAAVAAGGGGGSSIYINNGLVNPAKFTNDPAATGGVIFRTNAAGEVLAYATNLPAGGSAPTNIVYINNTFTQPARFTNNPAVNGGVMWSLDVNGNIVGTATNAPGITTVSNLWQTLGYVDIIVENTGGTSSSVTFTNYGGIVTNVTQLGNTGSSYRLQLGLTFNQNIGTNYLVFFDFDGSDDADASYALVGWSQSSARATGSCEVSIINTDSYVYSNDGFKIRIRIINPNAVAGLITVPTVVTNDRLFSWSADRMIPGTNAAIQAAYRILGDGIATYEFDGTNSTGDEITMMGVWNKDVGSSSYAVLNFASDDTANTVCWQVQLQALTLRGLDTNLWTTAALWTSNVPGTARVGTNIIIPIASSPFSGSGTNDYGKPYALRVTRQPGSDSSTSNAYLIAVDHRFIP